MAATLLKSLTSNATNPTGTLAASSVSKDLILKRVNVPAPENVPVSYYNLVLRSVDKVC